MTIQATSTKERQNSKLQLVKSLIPALDKVGLAILNQAPTLDTHSMVAGTTTSLRQDVHMVMVDMTKVHLQDRSSKMTRMQMPRHISRVTNLDTVDHKSHQAPSHGISDQPMVSHHLVRDILAKATINRTNMVKAGTGTAKDRDTKCDCDRYITRK